jgi:heme/copper-type cytochrome/quinol oxidase subunit 2
VIEKVMQHVADAKVQCFQGVACDTGLPTTNASQANLTIIMQLTFGIIGAIAAIVIVVAALSMVSAQGEPQKITKARQTIIFAAVGLAIAVSAEAIVTFTIGKL